LRVLLTGGSGDLGHILARQLDEQGDIVQNLDIRPPASKTGIFIHGSVLDRATLAQVMTSVDCVVHIAAWHGIHEFRKQKNAYDFWDLNVTGTFNVLEAAAQAGISRVVFISSTSIDEPNSIYGHSKILAEEIARAYVVRHNMNIITLRPRAFIPHWNKEAYNNFVEWAQWFWGGAVHINDVAQAVMKSLQLLSAGNINSHLVLTVDGAYDYTDEDLQYWDKDGSGATFRKYYAPYYGLAISHGLNPAQKPDKYNITDTRRWLGYQPAYSLRNLLEELATYGLQGPPPP
jgi:nucleoside-diphosphate-sugar epimerase